MLRVLVGAALGFFAAVALFGALAAWDQLGPPERLAEAQGPQGEWYALYAEYPIGDYDPSWHVYRFPSRGALDSARVRRGFGQALFETYEEAGDDDDDATLEIRDGRFLVFSKVGLYHALYDIKCDRILINDQSPFHSASDADGAPKDINSPEWPRFYLQWKLSHLHQPIAEAISTPGACAG